MQVWEPRLYDLARLSDYLDLSSYNGRKSLPEYGLGRNCTLFEKTRLWAYKAIRQGWPDYPEWLAACVTGHQDITPSSSSRSPQTKSGTRPSPLPNGRTSTKPRRVQRGAGPERCEGRQGIKGGEGRAIAVRTSPIYCRRFCGLRLRVHQPRYSGRSWRA